MNGQELIIARMRKGVSRHDAGAALGLSPQAYKLKETNETRFKDDQKLILVDLLDLDFDKFNLIFFDGKLPVKKWGIKYKKNTVA